MYVAVFYVNPLIKISNKLSKAFLTFIIRATCHGHLKHLPSVKHGRRQRIFKKFLIPFELTFRLKILYLPPPFTLQLLILSSINAIVNGVLHPRAAKRKLQPHIPLLCNFAQSYYSGSIIGRSQLPVRMFKIRK